MELLLALQIERRAHNCTFFEELSSRLRSRSLCKRQKLRPNHGVARLGEVVARKALKRAGDSEKGETREKSKSALIAVLR